jgi:hypothetical protein
VPVYDTKTSEVNKIPLVVNTSFTRKRRNLVLKIYQNNVDNEFCRYRLCKAALNCGILEELKVVFKKPKIFREREKILFT